MLDRLLNSALRGLIDQARRDGRRQGLYLLLGSASPDLLAQSGETLAGRIAYLELSPLTRHETTGVPGDRVWLRGGFPDSLTAAMLQRFWTMLAHHQGGLLNMSQFARNLGIENQDALLSHPVIGASWEGHVIENLLACSPRGTQGHFYRSSGGAEIDLLLSRPDGSLWAIEIKRSLSPKVERGFHAACEDLQVQRRLLVHPGQDAYPLAHGVEAVPLDALCAELLSLRRPS